MNAVIELYNSLYKQIDEKNDWVRFYNHGYGGKSLLEYDLFDSKFKNRANLYAHLFETFDIETTDKSLLDLGCGLGRGCNLLSKHYKFSSITGFDLNPNHINFARNHFPNLRFLETDCSNLQGINENFDLVISVESVNYYINQKTFYAGLYKVLKKNGKSLLTLPIKTMGDIVVDRNFSQHNFRIIEKRNITEHVILGLEEDKDYLLNTFSEVDKNILNAVIENLNVYLDSYNKKQIKYFTYYVEPIL